MSDTKGITDQNDHKTFPSKQECVNALIDLGYPVSYEPRVWVPEHRGGEPVEMSVFDAVHKLRIRFKTDSALANRNEGLMNDMEDGGCSVGFNND